MHAPEAEKLLDEAREVVLAAVEEHQDQDSAVADFETLKGARGKLSGASYRTGPGAVP